MTLYCFSAPYTPQNVASVFEREPYTIWFDSARSTHPRSRYSYVLFLPSDVYQGLSFDDQKKIFSQLNEPENILSCPVPFCGGLAGYWGYDLVRRQEDIHEVHPQCRESIPDSCLGHYDEFFAYDHLKEEGWYICVVDTPQNAEEKFANFRKRIDGTRFVESKISTENHTEFFSDFSREEYMDAIGKIIDHILNGDIFQANMTRRYQAIRPDGFDPFLHYIKLRKENAAPYSVYMNMKGFHVLSTSPELFLSVDKDGLITTRPIKGTAKNAYELRESKKDRAENIMIVDLMRNDLSKICTDQSVNVPSLCNVEEFEGLAHLVSTIQGQLGNEYTSLDALQAVFPGGSITGAPKIEAMRVIEKLERSRRGIYCGALGWVGYDGAMETNIAIRTVICDDKEIWFNVGGGITLSSNPAQEYEETLLKAERILASFDGGKNNCPHR